MLVLIVQVLQPTKNVAEGISVNDISNVYAVPVEIKNILDAKCYDCHSHNTRYPWYIHIQPIGWWMASHIKEAKGHLNFSEFKNYDSKKAAHKLKEITEEVTHGSMPLKSYVWLHADAKLTDKEKKILTEWIRSLDVAESEQD